MLQGMSMPKGWPQMRLARVEPENAVNRSIVPRAPCSPAAYDPITIRDQGTRSGGTEGRPGPTETRASLRYRAEFVSVQQVVRSTGTPAWSETWALRQSTSPASDSQTSSRPLAVAKRLQYTAVVLW